MKLLPLALDWNLALRRLRLDLEDDFWPDPYRFEDFFSQKTEDLMPQLERFEPSEGVSHPIPKAGFTLRDSIQIPILDRLVYQALVDRLIPELDPVLSASAFSSRLRNRAHKRMFRHWLDQTKHFKTTVRNQIAETPNSFLVVTDIARYYETINFRELRKQLESIVEQVNPRSLMPVLQALLEFIERWSPYDYHGLIQNTEPSAFVGNIFLDSVDKVMAREGYPICRYMDDIHIVVADEATGRKALMRLIALLRELGLGVNSQKTGIYKADSGDVQKYISEDDPDIEKIEQAVRSKDTKVIEGIMGLLFDKTTRLITDNRCGESTFKYCLKRIRTLQSSNDFTLPDCSEINSAVLSLLVRQPSETTTLCQYLEVASLSESHVAEITRLLIEEPLCVYSWQNFYLWKLVTQRGIQSQELTRRAYTLMGSDPADPAVAGAALYLGERGDYADRQVIAKLVKRAPKGLLARCYRVAIQQLPQAERVQVDAEVPPDQNEQTLGAFIDAQTEPVYATKPPEISIEDLRDAVSPIYG